MWRPRLAWQLCERSAVSFPYLPKAFFSHPTPATVSHHGPGRPRSTRGQLILQEGQVGPDPAWFPRSTVSTPSLRAFHPSRFEELPEDDAPSQPGSARLQSELEQERLKTEALERKLAALERRRLLD